MSIDGVGLPGHIRQVEIATQPEASFLMFSLELFNSITQRVGVLEIFIGGSVD